jgi:hypothetical protein
MIRFGRGIKRCATKHLLWSPGTRRSGHPEGARLRLFALRATTELGEAIASALGWPLSAHEERQFEDGEHKTRPLETVGGMDVYVMQSLHGGPSKSADDKIGRLLFFIARSRTPGRRSWCRPRFRPNINRFYIWPARRPSRDEAV